MKKYVSGRDLSCYGAFSSDETVVFRLELPRRMAASGVVMRIRREDDGTCSVGTASGGTGPCVELSDRSDPDRMNAAGCPSEGGSSCCEITAAESDLMSGGFADIPFSFVSTDFQTDVYRLELDLKALCGGRPSGFFRYGFLFLRGFDTLFSEAESNLRVKVAGSPGKEFILTAFPPSFRVPDTAGGIMYQIFVDRFFRGSGRCVYRDGAVMLSPGSGLPYAEIRGTERENNEFYGGNLFGVTDKLDYLESLGVTMIYLSPVFDSPSNHKYDTSDYEKIDPGFGGEAAFDSLLAEAKRRGIRVIIDGVFNHTGNDSRYFDAFGRYGGGALEPGSDYAGWYRFGDEYKNGYESWWDIKILPRLRTDLPPVEDYFAGEGGIADRYIRRGAGGIRLDVVDELPDRFLQRLRRTVKAADPDALLIGEVWEDAADKYAYGRRRRYFDGGELDSVMNYPLRKALLDFGAFGKAEELADTLDRILASYPWQVSRCLMNIIGSHDTLRALSFLGDPERCLALADEKRNRILAGVKLSERQYDEGKKRLMAVSAVQYTVFGYPCLYYGDETGAEGMADPFCRGLMRFPGEDPGPDPGLLAHYRRLGEIRRSYPSVFGGGYRRIAASDGYFEFERFDGSGRNLTVAVNCGRRRRRCRAKGRELYTGADVDGICLGYCEFALILSGCRDSDSG
ncbi:MAG: glycoside hydrolase family 13 protein [Clostridia bacterium]|nr:glycoside hydrolase family 13 protein [Clostridia bacterium]